MIINFKKEIIIPDPGYLVTGEKKQAQAN